MNELDFDSWEDYKPVSSKSYIRDIKIKEILKEPDNF